MNSGEEQIDDLYLHGLKIIQKKDHFRYGTDAVVLSDFAAKYIAKGSRVLDIGTGTGILPILLSGKTEAARFVGIEIQGEMAEMAARSVAMNEAAGVLERSRICIETCDIQTADRLFPTRSFDAVVTNPPYKRRGSGILNETEQLQIARHEITCTLSEWIERSAFFL